MLNVSVWEEKGFYRRVLPFFFLYLQQKSSENIIYHTMKRFILLCFSAFVLTAVAQNPIIRNQFTADPTARVFNGKVYLYPSHDIYPPEGQRQDWFCMEDYHVFSSENLTDWTDHGMIVTQNKVPWVRPNSYSMWAPDCVYRNGKYYFYFPSAPAEGGGFAVGVAIADSPEGPFVPEPQPIKGIFGIDPCVLLASDGNAYIFWGNGRCAKLKDNMKELADDNPRETVKFGNREMEMVGVHCLKDLPNRQAEGPFAFEYNGNYYLTYPYVRQNTEVLAYAMSKNPMGPYEYKGLIMAEQPNGCWTNHHSIVNYKGQWYLFYHHNYFSPRDDKRRSACIEKLCFNADGTIQEVKQTMRGVGVNKATEKIEIDRYSNASAGVTTALIDTVNTFRSYQATLPTKGSWFKYDDIDFSMIADGYLVISAKASDNTEFCIREKNEKGKILARIKMNVKPEEPAGGAANAPMGRFRRDMRWQWLTQTASLEYVPKGVADLVITNEGNGALSVDWVQFKNRQLYFTPVDKKAAAASPDEHGFIRRWRLMEPQKQEIRSNVIFTDSWLRETFANELAKLPKQKAKWYAMESPTYNMKLFHFAEKYGSQAYGNLFWCETVINCPEEMTDVRLAAGSNGASMWWLNGEEVLLLEGDRRMVVDDGVSKRLTLEKGRNTLRGAVINGPGLSDMCVRFVDEQGKPVKGYTIE